MGPLHSGESGHVTVSTVITLESERTRRLVGVLSVLKGGKKFSSPAVKVKQQWALAPSLSEFGD